MLLIKEAKTMFIIVCTMILIVATIIHIVFEKIGNVFKRLKYVGATAIHLPKLSLK